MPTYNGMPLKTLPRECSSLEELIDWTHQQEADASKFSGPSSGFYPSIVRGPFGEEIGLKIAGGPAVVLNRPSFESMCRLSGLPVLLAERMTRGTLLSVLQETLPMSGLHLACHYSDRVHYLGLDRLERLGGLDVLSLLNAAKPLLDVFDQINVQKFDSGFRIVYTAKRIDSTSVTNSVEATLTIEFDTHASCSLKGAWRCENNASDELRAALTYSSSSRRAAPVSLVRFGEFLVDCSHRYENESQCPSLQQCCE